MVNFIEEDIDSVLNQTLENEKYEIIVMTNVNVPLREKNKKVRT